MRLNAFISCATLALAAVAAQAEPIGIPTYDTATGVLTLPHVQVSRGPAPQPTYLDVVLRIDSMSLLTISGGEQPYADAQARRYVNVNNDAWYTDTYFDGRSSTLRLGNVRVGDTLYSGVKLQPDSFTVLSAGSAVTTECWTTQAKIDMATAGTDMRTAIDILGCPGVLVAMTNDANGKRWLYNWAVEVDGRLKFAYIYFDQATGRVSTSLDAKFLSDRSWL